MGGLGKLLFACGVEAHPAEAVPSLSPAASTILPALLPHCAPMISAADRALSLRLAELSLPRGNHFPRFPIQEGARSALHRNPGKS
jgi:hypothetical protein